MQILTDHDQKELKPHGSFSFPLLISHERLSAFDLRSFCWHWHPEIELTLVTSGDILYQVNDKVYHLHEGQGLFCNQNALHSGHRADSPDCHYLSITFHPRLLYGYSSSLMQEKYVNPILQNPDLSSLLLSPEIPWQMSILSTLQQFPILGREHPEAPEFSQLMSLLSIWQLLFEHTKIPAEGQSFRRDRDTERIRMILEFIQAHYAESITLQDIADQIHLCRSEVCRLFQRYMNQTLIAYLTSYRIEQSLPLLRDTSYSISDIAARCGFAVPGYYTKTFREHIGCSPRKYRAQPSMFSPGAAGQKDQNREDFQTTCQHIQNQNDL